MIAAGAQDRSYIRSGVLSGFSEFIIGRGGNPTALLERAGIDPRALGSPDLLISYTRKGVLLEQASRELAIAALGLEWVLSIPPHFPSAGPMLLLREVTLSFGDWMERALRYWRVQTNALIQEVIPDTDAGVVVLRMTPRWPEAASRQQMEYMLGTIVRLARVTLEDETWAPVGVRFRHERPEETAAHDLLFRCPVAFGADHDEIWLFPETLARPLVPQEKALPALADGFLRQRIALLPRYVPSLSTSTALAIQTVLGTGLCSKEFIASALGCSPRKLQRLLAREGTSYEEVPDSVRRELACGFLAETRVPIASIGSMLDFASAAALTLAVRRWTGTTPSLYRRNSQQVADPEPAA